MTGGSDGRRGYHGGRGAWRFVGAIGLCLLGGMAVNAALTWHLEPVGVFENGDYQYRVGLPFASVVAQGHIAGDSCWISFVPGVWRIHWPGVIANSLIQSMLISLPFVIGSQMRRLRTLCLRFSHRKANRCPRCAYDLTGNVSSFCPECGAGVALVLSSARSR